MSFFDVLFHPTLLMATVFYTIMTISFEIIYQQFLYKTIEISSTHWIAKHIGTPFFHILLLIAFIYMSYPVLYGLNSHNLAGERILPSISSLLNATSGQTMAMVNTLFVISVILPLVPIFHRLLALILPLQAMAASAMLYTWLAQVAELEYSIIPDFKSIALIVFFSFIADRLAKFLAALLGEILKSQYHTHDMTKVIYKSALLIFQVPILLIYTLSLSS